MNNQNNGRFIILHKEKLINLDLEMLNSLKTSNYERLKAIVLKYIDDEISEYNLDGKKNISEIMERIIDHIHFMESIKQIENDIKKFREVK